MTDEREYPSRPGPQYADSQEAFSVNVDCRAYLPSVITPLLAADRLVSCLWDLGVSA